MNRRNRPKVIANFAMTADGKVSTRELTPANFTSPSDKHRLLEIRAQGDAVMVGRNTLATDTMSMTLPDEDLRKARQARGLSPEPLRVIVSQKGRLDTSWKVFQSDGARRIVFATTQMPEAKRAELQPFCDLHLFDSEFPPLAEVLFILRKQYGVKTLVCEGGPTLLRSLIEAEALDVLYLTITPLVFGGKDAPTLSGSNPEFLDKITHCRLTSLQVIGNECFLCYHIRREEPPQRSRPGSGSGTKSTHPLS